MRKKVRTPLLHGDNTDEKRAEIKQYFRATFERYESLFELLNCDEAFYQRPDRLRHPLIFYYGHTAVFYINKLFFMQHIAGRIDPALESIFAVGVDEMGWDDLDESRYDWPSVEETKTYRNKVKGVVEVLIDTLPLELPIKWDSPFWIILMGIEHENIHIETSSVLFRQLELKYLGEDEHWSTCKSYGKAPQNQLLTVESGEVKLGKTKDAEYYGWDNEYGTHKAFVPKFKASKYLVSNAEFLPFVIEGGYENDTLWEEEGRNWKNHVHAKAPVFWIASENGYRLRLLTTEIPLPENWPIEVNFHEATAFCNWLSEKKGIRITLPTEDEYIRLHDFSTVPKHSEWEDTVPANINLEHFASSTPVDRFGINGFYDVIGNVWQWSRTPIYPFDGFEVHPAYDDFSVPTFDGGHYLIKGGSWISLGNEAQEKSRYAFRPHFFQHAGFRYVQSSYEEKGKNSNYEDDISVSLYCYFGWGEESLGVENFPKKCAETCIELMEEKNKQRALDIGCAIGRSTFELAKAFDEVVGIDFSTRFIRHATTLKEGETVHYAIPEEGELQKFYAIDLTDFGLDAVCHKVSFWQGDACNLKPVHNSFDLVFAGNLIDRLHSPKQFLQTLKKIVNPGGLAVLTSPYTWGAEHTPKEEWIGGYKRDGESVTTLEGLREILGDVFTLVETKDIPFVIKEHARKHQYTISHMSVWEKKS